MQTTEWTYEKNSTREALSRAYRVLIDECPYCVLKFKKKGIDEEKGTDEEKKIDFRTFMLFMYEYNPRIRKNKITHNYYSYQSHIALTLIFIVDKLHSWIPDNVYLRCPSRQWRKTLSGPILKIIWGSRHSVEAGYLCLVATIVLIIPFAIVITIIPYSAEKWWHDSDLVRKFSHYGLFSYGSMFIQ